MDNLKEEAKETLLEDSIKICVVTEHPLGCSPKGTPLVGGQGAPSTRKRSSSSGSKGGSPLLNGGVVLSPEVGALNTKETSPLSPRASSRNEVVIDPLDSPSGTASPPPSTLVVGPQPPDGGIRAWLVMIGSFLCNGIIFGTINSGGIIFEALLDLLLAEGVTNPASKASLTMSLAIGTTFFLSMIAGVLTDKLGIRLTTMVGAAIATLGMLLSAWYYTNVDALIVTMGLLFGTGASLAYTPSLVILGHYFRKRIGIVNGFVTAGSSVFTIAMPFLLPYVIETHGLRVTYQILAAMMAVLILCGFIFKPLLPEIPPSNPPSSPECKNRRHKFKTKCHNFFAQIINFEIWRNKKFVIWTLAIPSSLFGYFVPYVHLVKYSKIVLGEDAQTQVLVMCIGVTSGVGRIVFGLMADRPWVNRILLQQISFYCIGSLTMLLTAANSLWVFIVICLGMGLFDGCFISLLGPIAFDIVGPSGASQAIGCLLALCSIPLTIGPFVAGVMYDHLGSYTVPFLVAGIPPIIGASALFLIRFVKENKEKTSSPATEPREPQNNAAASLTSPSGPEDHSSILQGGANSEEDHLCIDSGKGAVLSPGTEEAARELHESAELLHVDVQNIALAQRESCV